MFICSDIGLVSTYLSQRIHGPFACHVEPGYRCRGKRLLACESGGLFVWSDGCAESQKKRPGEGGGGGIPFFTFLSPLASKGRGSIRLLASPTTRVTTAASACFCGPVLGV